MRQMSARRHRERASLSRSTVHGVVFAFLHEPPLVLPAKRSARHFDSALQRELCRRGVRPFIDIPSQFFRSANAVQAARFSPFADVLTFLGLSF
jgi:hypothetical protein